MKKEEITKWVDDNIHNYELTSKDIVEDMLDDFKGQVLDISRNASFGFASYMEGYIRKKIK